MKNYNEKEESSYTQYLDANNLYGWAMSQKSPVSGFKWEKDISKFTKEFIKSMMKIAIKDIFLKQMLIVQKVT